LELLELKIDETSNLLMSLPGGKVGPSGVIIFSENYVTYYHQNQIDNLLKTTNTNNTNNTSNTINTNNKIIKKIIPRRSSYGKERGLLVISCCVFKRKKSFFSFFQSEVGDIYKLVIDIDENLIVKDIKINFFDSVPQANSIYLLRSGYLFIASEFGDQL
jgi:splicing factor 3B subunit 3